MSIFKSEMFLILIALVIFGIFIAFSTGVIDPSMEEIGQGMRSLISKVFGATGFN
ncbi:hypothetical protein MHH70_01850 [Metasolibacillus sp. FSL H7-0170]|uniref:hypothetical protein n=1 Tax=Metasolibacillus TaxID=2703677 RepID=UPI00137960D9|nr:hypothetical protein [Metasolibacillus fluoroglycofenilyticus]